jgi:hypothetical protein
MAKRCTKIEKVFEKLIGASEIDRIYTNENETDIIENETDIIENLDKDSELDKYCHNSDYILERIYNIFLYLQNIFKFIISVSGIYLAWICLHYLASHLYVKFCVPSTVMGFLLSPFMTATPHCQGLRWVVYNAANMINNMWIVCGTWICTSILNVNTRIPHDIPS